MVVVVIPCRYLLVYVCGCGCVAFVGSRIFPPPLLGKYFCTSSSPHTMEERNGGKNNVEGILSLVARQSFHDGVKIQKRIFDFARLGSTLIIIPLTAGKAHARCETTLHANEILSCQKIVDEGFTPTHKKNYQQYHIINLSTTTPR